MAGHDALQNQVIDLTFSSDENEPPTPPRRQRRLPSPKAATRSPVRDLADIEDDEMFDPPPLPKVEPPSPDMSEFINDEPHETYGLSEGTLEALLAASFTDQDCLTQAREVFPDICADFVLERFRRGLDQGKVGREWCNEIINDIVEEKTYPKERDKKRKRSTGDEEEVDEAAKWKRPGREVAHRRQLQEAGKLLKAAFPEIPRKFIDQILKTKGNLFPAYLTLNELQRLQPAELPYRKIGRYRRRSSSEVDVAFDRFPGAIELQNELAAAAKFCVKANKLFVAEVAAKEEMTRKEQENERLAMLNGEMRECGCCFTESPMNRMTYCDGEEAHFFCFTCATSYVDSILGERKCRPKCMNIGGCGAPFRRSQLIAFLDPKTFDRLEKLQQEEDLRLAGIEDLAECPFCDYKAIYPPVEVNREFQCRNEACGRTSCRLCNRDTHVPLSCKEANKDAAINTRHKVEEKMTEALVRECNNCKTKFIKEDGCNKVRCNTCHNLQCYVCHQSIRDYNHFHKGKCPLYDNTDTRHLDEVRRAEEQALAELRTEHPELSEEDLRIQLSEAVKEADKRRVQQTDVLLHGRGAVVPPPPPRAIFGGNQGQAVAAVLMPPEEFFGIPAPIAAPVPAPPRPARRHRNRFERDVNDAVLAGGQVDGAQDHGNGIQGLQRDDNLRAAALRMAQALLDDNLEELNEERDRVFDHINGRLEEENVRLLNQINGRLDEEANRLLNRFNGNQDLPHRRQQPAPPVQLVGGGIYYPRDHPPIQFQPGVRNIPDDPFGDHNNLNQDNLWQYRPDGNHLHIPRVPQAQPLPPPPVIPAVPAPLFGPDDLNAQYWMHFQQYYDPNLRRPQ